MHPLLILLIVGVGGMLLLSFGKKRSTPAHTSGSVGIGGDANDSHSYSSGMVGLVDNNYVPRGPIGINNGYARGFAVYG